MAYRKLPTDTPTLVLPTDAITGADERTAPFYEWDAAARAAAVLGAPPTLLGTSVTWWGPGMAAFQQGGGHPLGPAVPAFRVYAFTGEDGRGRGYALISYDARRGLLLAENPTRLTSQRTRGRSGSPLPMTLPEPAQPLAGAREPNEIYRLVEEAGGRALREGWERRGESRWSVSVDQYMQDGRPVAMAFYFLFGAGTEVRFRVDLASGRVERVP